jgi:hypothetical protein
LWRTKRYVRGAPLLFLQCRLPGAAHPACAFVLSAHAQLPAVRRIALDQKEAACVVFTLKASFPGTSCSSQAAKFSRGSGHPSCILHPAIRLVRSASGYQDPGKHYAEPFQKIASKTSVPYIICPAVIAAPAACPSLWMRVAAPFAKTYRSPGTASGLANLGGCRPPRRHSSQHLHVLPRFPFPAVPSTPAHDSCPPSLATWPRRRAKG